MNPGGMIIAEPRPFEQRGNTQEEQHSPATESIHGFLVIEQSASLRFLGKSLPLELARCFPPLITNRNRTVC